MYVPTVFQPDASKSMLMLTSSRASMTEYVRTTIKIREDLLQKLKRKSGKRKVSEEINKILEEKLAKKESLFGTMPETDVTDVRDHRERS